ncbi:dihydrodipicolinate synthase family protein [Paenibacillus cymbidii]|uniref:dihydrodipicolinate synthase family protein n=1 Tax=Paenibacillus cymbidii TaxID=1639034 RepID=UPI001081ED35|nr:dihydrodipicolinate synthase family protein [Paenibacillus cymbidii]
MKLQGNLPVIPTPFTKGGIEYAGFDKLFDRVLEDLDGYVVCGSTGEAPALTTRERIEIMNYVARITPKGKTAVVGLGHSSLEDAVRIGSAAAEAGARAALVPSPYYFPNSLEMIIDYVGQLALKTGLDIVFYDNPVTTKTVFTTDSLIALANAVPKVTAIKMTDHNLGKIRELKERTGLSVFGGDDIICYRAFEAGVDGNMIIAPIIYPASFKACWEMFRSGNGAASFDLYCRVLLPFISMFGPGDEIPATKMLFHRLGLYSSPETRSPLLTSDARRTKEVMEGYYQGLRGEHSGFIPGGSATASNT